MDAHPPHCGCGVVVLPPPSGVAVGEKALWPMVAVVLIVCAMLTTMVVSHVDTVSLVAIIGVLFTGISSLIGVVLYGKLTKVESNTNGRASDQQDLVVKLMDALRASVPVDSLKKDE